MTARPTAAAARFPYAHSTMEDLALIEELKAQGRLNAADLAHKNALSQAHYALNRVQRQATHTHSQGGAPRNRRAEEAGAPTPASNFAGVA